MVRGGCRSNLLFTEGEFASLGKMLAMISFEFWDGSIMLHELRIILND